MFGVIHHVTRMTSIALALSLSLVMAGGASAEVIVLRSGNATMGNPDPFITMLVGSGATPLSSQPFSSVEFDSACTGASAIVSQPHPAWLAQLPCDPEAKWIGVDALATPASALYCYNFDVESCCIEQATLNICWVTDDVLGDPASYGGPNPDGVYLNGFPINPSIAGGNYATETLASADVTDLVSCGSNSLQIYNRDLGYVVSGVMFSATIEILECSTPTDDSTWGKVKSLFR